MTTSIQIDESGSLILPKEMRDSMKLENGSWVKAELIGDRIQLSQNDEEVILAEEEGLPVIVGWEGFDAVRAVAESREQHLGRLSGGQE